MLQNVYKIYLKSFRSVPMSNCHCTSFGSFANVNARSRDRREESKAIVEEKWRKGKGRANGKVGRLMEGKLKGEGGNMQLRLGSREGGGSKRRKRPKGKNRGKEGWLQLRLDS